MYEELIDRMRNWAASFCGCCRKSNKTQKVCDDCNAVYGDLWRAADAIEHLQKLTDAQLDIIKQHQVYLNKQQWIPVTEQLPKYGDWVLGIGPKRGYHVCEYRGITHFPYSGDSPWFSAKGRTLTITHWMPLPAPPKEET